MVWECAECNAADSGSNRVDVVCHHCGKPLCQRDRIQLDDDAFGAVDEPVSRSAFHCRECRRRHHPRLAAMEGRRE
jgi:hypothetical protein